MDIMGMPHLPSAGGANSSSTTTGNTSSSGGSNDSGKGGGGGATSSLSQEVLDQQTTMFMNATPTNASTTPYSLEKLPYLIADQSTELGEFLSRPVKIDTKTWATTDTIDDNDTIYPFHAYFSNTNIKYKLHNWAYMRCNLHVRFVYNASPFYYGTYMYAWQPMESSGYAPYIYNSTEEESHVPLSQLSKVLITPQTSQSADLDIPFIYPFDFVSVDDEDYLKGLGTLHGRPLALLQSANGEAGSVTISIYAWATDVILYGATHALAMQGGDEYAMDGPVSKPATAVANIASNLSMMPVIGPFATATSIGANAIAKIAKLFGYTNVPVVDDHKPVQSRAFPFFSTVDTGFPLDKLSLDCKNELSIDGSVCGTEAIDELVISHLVRKESFLTSFQWSNTDDEDDLLWTSAVTPQLYAASGDTQFYLNMTPMCWVATMFKYWRGDIVFRFKLNCSGFHKGRLRFTFDPLGIASVSADTQMTCFTRIVDIEPSTDIEIRVPYQQYRAWLSAQYYAKQLTASAIPYGSGVGNNHSRAYTNGTISVRVQTALTSPLAEASVDILVFVRGAENLEFALPEAEAYKDVCIGSELQDGNLSNDSETTEEVGIGHCPRPTDHIYLTYMGEQVASLRPLLHRMCYVTSWQKAYTSQAAQLWTSQLLRTPPKLGYDTYGLTNTKGAISTEETFKFNWCHPHWLGIISAPFLGNRGSVNWTICNTGGSSLGHPIRVTRHPGMTSASLLTAAYTASTVVSELAKFNYVNYLADGNGSLLQHTRNHDGVNFQVPFYSAYKFASNSPTASLVPSPTYGTSKDGFSVTIKGTTSALLATNLMEFFAGGGPDYTLVNFLFVPSMAVMTTLPLYAAD
jgi:hypothetical protein